MLLKMNVKRGNSWKDMAFQNGNCSVSFHPSNLQENNFIGQDKFRARCEYVSSQIRGQNHPRKFYVM